MVGSDIDAGTDEGLSVSADGGDSWKTSLPKNDGPAEYSALAVAVADSTVYVANGAGLLISDDDGSTWRTAGQAEGLASDEILGLYASGAVVYARTANGLCVTTDRGASWNTYSASSGLGDDRILGVHVSGSSIYAATGWGVCPFRWTAANRGRRSFVTMDLPANRSTTLPLPLEI